MAPFAYLVFFVSLISSFCLHVSAFHEARTCELSHSDGADAFEQAARNPDCDTILIGPSTTLNITTKLNLTGISNKHIVRTLCYILIPCITYCMLDGRRILECAGNHQVQP